MSLMVLANELLYQLMLKKVKRPSHDELKLANSCWQTCWQTVGDKQNLSLFVANSLPTCLLTVVVPFTRANLSLSTRVCQFSLSCERPLYVFMPGAMAWFNQLLNSFVNLGKRPPPLPPRSCSLRKE